MVPGIVGLDNYGISDQRKFKGKVVMEIKLLRVNE
jgi:hypothetical protein